MKVYIKQNRKRGDRIAQLVVLPIATIYFEEVDSLNITNRGDGGVFLLAKYIVAKKKKYCYYYKKRNNAARNQKACKY